MTVTAAWRVALLLDLDVVDADDLVLSSYGLQVAQLILELALTVLAAKHVDAIEDGVRHASYLAMVALRLLHCDGLGLNPGLVVLLDAESGPLVVLEV